MSCPALWISQYARLHPPKLGFFQCFPAAPKHHLTLWKGVVSVWIINLSMVWKWRDRSGGKSTCNYVEKCGYNTLTLKVCDKCNFYMIFIILSFIKIVIFPLFLLIWFDFYLYLSIHLCFEGMRRFQINLQGLYMQSGARAIESS